MKGDSPDKLYAYSTLRPKKGILEPDSLKSERSTVPVSSWLKDRIGKLPKIDNKLTKLIDIISDPELLFAAYELIKHKKGNMTPGVNKETLDGVS